MKPLGFTLLKNQENHKRWAFPQTKDRQPGEKAIPMGVKLGNQRDAIEVLKYFLEQLNAQVEDSGDGPPF
jgi:hypothetical protein